jgi:acyl carrier protein
MKPGLVEIKDGVRKYLAGQLLPGKDPSALEDDRPLITGGLMDSITSVSLITFLEETYGVSFEAHEIGIDYLDSVADIARTVADKMKETT